MAKRRTLPKKCPVCKGKGWFKVKGERKVCDVCDGNGSC